MKVEAVNNSSNMVYGEQEFSNTIAVKKNPDSSFSSPKYSVFKVERTLLDDLRGYLEEIAEEAEEEDFDEDGYLKHFHEDERLSDFLKQFAIVEKKPNTYKVTVEFIVEAETEEEANEKVSDCIRGGDYETWEITDTEEEY